MCEIISGAQDLAHSDKSVIVELKHDQSSLSSTGGGIGILTKSGFIVKKSEILGLELRLALEEMVKELRSGIGVSVVLR